MSSKAVLLFLSLLSLSLCGRCPKRFLNIINFNKILRQTDCVFPRMRSLRDKAESIRREWCGKNSHCGTEENKCYVMVEVKEKKTFLRRRKKL